MKSLILALNLFLLIVLTGCQVKEETSSGNLVSGHVNVTNTFTLTTPSANTFISGETLSLVLTFPFDVTVTGTPRLVLNVGGATTYADYSSGDQTGSLVFTYTFVGGDNDTDGITVSSLDLNGGSFTFVASGGVITNCDSTTVTSTTFSNVKVDNTTPAPTAFALSNLPGFYNKSDRLDFLVTFNEAVTVTGTPRILLDFQVGAAVYATYTGGTGTTVLGFSLTIDNTIADTNAYDSIGNSIDLNGGTIEDSVGNDSSLSLAAYVAAVQTYSATVNFDGRLPYVVSVTPPSNGSYNASQLLDFVVEYDRAVTISGSPYIGITIPAGVRQASYASGSGTNLIHFSYTTVPGDVDSDGIAVASTITANSGTIVGTAAPANSYFSPAANNAFVVPSTTGIILNSIQPQPLSASRNTDSTSRLWGGVAPDDTWIIGQQLLISVLFNTNMYVSQTGGTPRIPLTIGATTQYATYLSGGNGQTTLVFTYTIQDGDLDTDNSIAIGTIDLNGGTITDVSATNSVLTIPTTALTTTRIDGVRPTISSISAPADATYSTVTNMNFTINWSEAVNCSPAMNIPLTIGATAVNAVYVSGNNTATMIHRPSLTGRNDSDGIAIASPMTGAGSIRDQAGNLLTDFTFTPPVTTGILVDTNVPTILTFTPPANGTYIVGNNLDFSVQFDGAVNITTSGGYPRIPLVMTSGTRYATYSSGSGTDTIVFRYTIVTNDVDANGITTPTAIDVTAPSYIRDLGLNGATSYAFTTNLTGILVDGVVPSISSRTIPANGTYESGDVLTFTTTYSESVTVTGTPRITVAAQTGSLNFDYTGGSGTTVLTYSYTVTANDFDFDGLPSSVTTVSLNGGTIQDASLNNAGLTFTAANLSSVFIAYPDTVVWSLETFSNLSAIPGLSVTSGGAATTQACGTGTCRTFNGDDTFNISGALANAEEVFIVFRAPSALANLDLFSTDISLQNDGTAFDLVTDNASINLDGASTSGTTHDVNMSTASVHILHAAFTTPISYGAGALITSSYLGGVAEVIIVNSTLTPAQRSAILTYLNNKF